MVGASCISESETFSISNIFFHGNYNEEITNQKYYRMPKYMKLKHT